MGSMKDFIPGTILNFSEHARVGMVSKVKVVTTFLLVGEGRW